MILALELVPKVVSQIFNLQDDVGNWQLSENNKVGQMLVNGFEVGLVFHNVVIFAYGICKYGL